MPEGNGDYLILRTIRVNALYNNAATPVIVMLCGAVGLATTFWDATNSTALISWFSILFIITAARCFLVFKYHRTEIRPEQYPYWLDLYFVGTMLSGFAWGSTAYLLPIENSPIELGLITMFMLVVISGSIGIYSIFKRVYYALSLPTILPLIFFLFIQEDKQLNQLCLITSVFTFFIFVVHYHAQKIANELLILKFDNKILLDHHETDQERINTLERLNRARSDQLEKAQSELNYLKMILKK